MIRLTYEQFFLDGKSNKCVIETESEFLSDVLVDLECLLRGASFVFKGHLDIVDDSELRDMDESIVCGTFLDESDNPKYNTDEVKKKTKKKVK